MSPERGEKLAVSSPSDRSSNWHFVCAGDRRCCWYNTRLCIKAHVCLLYHRNSRLVLSSAPRAWCVLYFFCSGDAVRTQGCHWYLRC